MRNKIMELRRLIKNQRLSPKELHQLQNRKLQAIVRNAYENVVYYRQLFDSVGLQPRDIQTTDDLKKIPITTREVMQNQPLESLIAKGIDVKKCKRELTSGSTGRPLAVYLTPEEVTFQNLVQARTFLSLGFKPTERLALIGPTLRGMQGSMFFRLLQKLGLFRIVEISPFTDVTEQIERIKDTKPTIWWIYPSFLRSIVDSVTESDARKIKPRMLLSGAMPLHQEVRDRVKSVWNDVEIMIVYGSIEFGRIAWECHQHEGLHLSMDSLVVECIKEERRDIAVTVITSLYSYAMPFIRYRLGDVCEFSDARCPCGISFTRIFNLQGRSDDFVKLHNGRVIAPEKLLILMNKIDGIRKFKMIQEHEDELAVKLIPDSKNAGPVVSNVDVKLREFMAIEKVDKLKIKVQAVEEIEKSPGKERIIVSKVV